MYTDKMKYVRQMFTIPEDVAKRLSKERNKSARVTETLKAYYEGRDELGSLVGRLDSIEEQVKVTRRTMEDLKIKLVGL